MVLDVVVMWFIGWVFSSMTSALLLNKSKTFNDFYIGLDEERNLIASIVVSNVFWPILFPALVLGAVCSYIITKSKSND